MKDIVIQTQLLVPAVWRRQVVRRVLRAAAVARVGAVGVGVGRRALSWRLAVASGIACVLLSDIEMFPVLASPPVSV